MARGPEFLKVDDVKEAHAAALERWSGASGVRDEGALDAAVMQPQASFDGEHLYEDIFQMAAAYGFHISQAHAFIDGNKRAAALAMVTFLDMNGFRIPHHENDILYLAVMEVATGTMTKQELALLLRQLAGIVVPVATTRLAGVIDLTADERWRGR
jgi:death-on-curing protein